MVLSVPILLTLQTTKIMLTQISETPTRFLQVKMRDNTIAVVSMDDKLLRLIDNAMFYRYMSSSSKPILISISTQNIWWISDKQKVVRMSTGDNMLYLKPFPNRGEWSGEIVPDVFCFVVCDGVNVYFRIQHENTFVDSVVLLNQMDIAILTNSIQTNYIVK